MPAIVEGELVELLLRQLSVADEVENGRCNGGVGYRAFLDSSSDEKREDGFTGSEIRLHNTEQLGHGGEGALPGSGFGLESREAFGLGEALRRLECERGGRVGGFSFWHSFNNPRASPRALVLRIRLATRSADAMRAGGRMAWKEKRRP